MTLINELGLDIPMMYLRTKNELYRSRQVSEVRARTRLIYTDRQTDRRDRTHRDVALAGKRPLMTRT